MHIESPSPSNHFHRDQAELILSSYRHWTGEDLLDQHASKHESVAEALFYAPIAVVSHGTEADPIFNYRNLRAMDAFGYDWAEWIRLPSRFSAEAPNREARQKLLEEVLEKGFSDGYQGVRIGKNGRFLIRAAKVWNLLDIDGQPCGQAACFGNWERLPTETVP